MKTHTEVRVVTWTRHTKTQGKSKHIVLDASLYNEGPVVNYSTKIMHELCPVAARKLAYELLKACVDVAAP